VLNRVDRILLRVSGLEAAVRYYRDVLGMRLGKQERRVASFSLGEGDDAPELVLHDDPDLPGEAVYFRVDDVRQIYKDRAKLKLTFSGPPVQVSRGYRATAKDPFGTVLLLLDRTAESVSTQGIARTTNATIEDARPAGGGLFSGIEQRAPARRAILAKVYEQIGRTADDLPYTPQFEQLHRAYIAGFPDPKPTRAETWRHLLNLRKAGKLPKLGDARSMPPPVTPEQQQALRDALGKDIGKRDRLPYTDRFDAIVDAFNHSQGRPLSPHHVWRLVARLAK
jgi:catechol 2,3-dioxygenase-like lactoylglutathione lyase family enzyme